MTSLSLQNTVLRQDPLNSTGGCCVPGILAVSPSSNAADSNSLGVKSRSVFCLDIVTMHAFDLDAVAMHIYVGGVMRDR